ncbi:hypothetical protein J32TS6_11150 [Virgibacillus pantothenticus]|uniref:lamin tail domain-containing protein n=1 Tax=Virgibacillus pantothenticus TaxID=1473 RepID=UPI001B250035|nr:lamin tail domain-containing protein [Virgibacillus pantothenticus]GIP62560.1 hypothetical protein J32TS6_11150 [Virgibacillus pantothenticus]
MAKSNVRAILAALIAIMVVITNFLQSTTIAYAAVSTPKMEVTTGEQNQEKQLSPKEKSTLDRSEEASKEPLTIQHEPPKAIAYMENHQLVVTIPHAEKATLFYQTTNVSEPVKVEMRKENNGEFMATVPAAALWAENITYWFEATTDREQVKTDTYTVPVQVQSSHNVAALPKLMVTEATFGKQPFIEIYNHTTLPINLQSYALFLGEEKVSFEHSKNIPSGKSHIIWFANDDQKIETFNRYYGTNLSDEHVTAVSAVPFPTTDQKITLRDKNKNDIVTEGNITVAEKTTGQLFYYTNQKTWIDGGFTTKATPGEILVRQVPSERMEVEENQIESNQENESAEDSTANQQNKQQPLNESKPEEKKQTELASKESILQHEPIKQASNTKDLTIEATASDDVTQLSLQFQTGQQMKIEELPFTKAAESNTFSATVPKEMLWSPNFFYQIVGKTMDGTEITYPKKEFIHVNVEQTEEMDTQTVPPILITEVTPDTSNINKQDGFEFIEIYNNTNQAIHMNDYQLIYRYPDGKPDQIWEITEDKEIKPQERFIVWIKNEGNQDKTLANFNAHYGLNLSESHVTEIQSDGMSNSGARTLIVADNFNNEIVSATYNDTNQDDTHPDQGIVYHYPKQGSSMKKAGIGETITPLTIVPGQVPKQPVRIDETGEKPSVDEPEFTLNDEALTVKVNITSKQPLLGATLSISQSDKTKYQTWQLEASKEEPTTYSVKIPREEIWSKNITYYFAASNKAGETKTEIKSYQLPTEAIDYQQVPPLIITESTPDTTNSNGADAYEFIEVYNNTTEAINFKDYLIRYRYPNTGAGNDLLWGPKEEEQVIIPSGETVVFWIINHGNTEKSAADFNSNYGTNLTEGRNLFKMYNNGMANSSHRTLVVATKTGKELSYSSYNDELGVDDTTANKGIIYRYPTDGGLHTTKISAGKWDATPGSILTEQVPGKKVMLPKDTEKPVIETTTEKEAITSEQPVTLSATITDNVDVKSVSIHYRTDNGEFRKVNLETQPNNHYEHIVYEPELIGKKTLEYYFVASDGENKSTSATSTMDINNPSMQDGLRLNVQDKELLSGEKVIKATADEAKDEPSLFIDQQKVKNTFKAIEADAYFAFDVKETNIYFKNGVAMGDEILHVFDDTYTKFTTLTIPVSADKLKQGENTISIRAGNKVGPFDETSKENRDDFTIKNIRLVLSDGTTIYDPAYSDPDQDYSIGDSTGKKPVYDFTFTLDQATFASTAYVFNTTTVQDGEHEIKTVLGNDEVTKHVVTDNTAPIITPSIKDRETYKGDFTIDAEVNDATSGVQSVTAQLDGEYISLPYNTSSSLLDPGKHEITYQATDEASNIAEKKITFHVVEEHPLLPDWLGSDSENTSANLSVTVKDPTNDVMDVDFYQSYQYTAEDANMVISQNATDTEPPKSYLPDGEARLTDAQLKQLQAVDGKTIDTTSDYQFPYHRFDVTVDKKVDPTDEVEIVWNGSSLEGRKVTMYAWNYATSEWDALVSTIAGKEAFELIGSVQGTEYMQDQKVSVIVQDQIANLGENFSFVWMADTQYYSESYPYIYEKQTEWIAENKEALNIEYVFHSGDLVNVYDDLEQWDVADRSMQTLDDANIPYGVVAGNHDVNNKSRDYSYYGQFFGEDRFKNNAYYGGSFKDNRGHYDLMSVNGMDFIMVHLGWGIEEDGIEWLNDVLQAHPNRKAILNVHEYLLATGSRSPTGDQLFEEVVVPNENVFAVLSGHYHNAQTLIDEMDDNGDGIADRTVYQMLADYQGGPEGGQGYLRILNFNMNTKQIGVETYSPYLDDYNYYDPEEYPEKDEFSFDFNMSAQTKQVATDYVEVNVYTDEKIGSVKDVPSGEKASVVWEGLDPNSEYFWYAVASDQYGGETRSDIWSFLTVDGEIVEPEKPEEPKNPERPSTEDNGGGKDQNDQGSTGTVPSEDDKDEEKPIIEQPTADNQEDNDMDKDDTEVPTIENTSNHNDSDSSLPNTATNMFHALFIGLLLLLLGSIVWLIHLHRKKRQALS